MGGAHMINRFGSLFAGHIDLDDMGFDATPANDRFYSNERLATVFDKTDAIAKTMDDKGYSTFWMAEHHFQREGYECIGNLLMEAVHLCHITDNIKIGCGFNIAPMWHPLRLAEDYATADILTKGRTIFGVGRGYHTREVEVYGNPMLDSDANRELFEEQVDVIMKAFHSDSFSHHGKNYTIPPRVPYRGYELEEITLVPRPLRQPVECWQPVVSASERGLRFMARHGIKGIIGGGAAPGGAAQAAVEAWQRIEAEHGRETEQGGNLIVSFSVYLAESTDNGIREARSFFEENMKMFAPLGFVRGLTDEQIAALGDPDKVYTANLPTLDQAVESGAWLIGTPEQVTEQLMGVQERWPGLEEINIGMPVGTPQSVIVEQLEQFAEEVMPAFKG
ncbi:MAG: LLM class flavin-dependent oxidoreductase [Chloroflexi bacterium]|nr:LLM class flavin-dependent oxidoreductase [Chloroflexota bacterium]